jgi:hypothetical protein
MCVDPGPALDASPDSPVDALDCTDPYEPNDDLTNAYATGVATSTSTRTLSSAKICPASDKDYYRLDVTSGSNIELIVADAPTGADISGSILNSNAQPLYNAIPVTGSPNQYRAYLPNMPAGTYLVLVSAVSNAPSPNDVGSYDVTLTVTAP